MAKYSEKLAKKIAALIEEDTYTISEICDMYRISRKTFYEWKAIKPEFRDIISEAEDRRDEQLTLLARRALRQRLEGYTTIEERTIYVPDKNNPDRMVVKSKVVKRKQWPPELKTAQAVLSDSGNNRIVASKMPELIIESDSPDTPIHLEALKNGFLPGNRTDNG